jgi:hypothetical protein
MKMNATWDATRNVTWVTTVNATGNATGIKL